MLLQAGTRVQGGEQARTRDALAWRRLVGCKRTSVLLRGMRVSLYAPWPCHGYSRSESKS